MSLLISPQLIVCLFRTCPVVADPEVLLLNTRCSRTRPLFPVCTLNGCLLEGGGRLSPPQSCVWHWRRAAPLSGALPARHGTTARAHSHHPSVHMVPPQPTSAHAATSTLTRCGEGALVGGWHAGASPSIPFTRSVMKGGSSSASVAHTYTPLGRSRRL